MRDIFDYVDNFEKKASIKSNLLFGNYESCSHPQISIIMPIYNRPDMFRLALQSALNQNTNEEYEIVVVDNNDIDYTVNLCVVKEFDAPNVFYYHHDENLGMYGNFNRGIQLSRSKYITFCHDDDLLTSDAISSLLRIQKKEPGKCIISNYSYIDGDGRIIIDSSIPQKKWGIHRKEYCEFTLLNLFMKSVGIGGGGFLFEREKMIALGGFNDEFYPSTDYALNVLYTQKFGSVFNPTITYLYRISANTSYQVATLFPNCDRHIRDCMKPYLSIPNYIFDFINMVKYEYSVVALPIHWGKASDTRPRLWQKAIVKYTNELSKIQLLKRLFI